MYIFLFFFLLISALIIIAFIYPIKVFLFLDCSKMILDLSIIWIIQINIKYNIETSRAALSTKFFGIKISRKFTVRKKKYDKQVIKSLSLYDTEVKLFYGLNKPHLTAMAFVILYELACFVQVDLLEIVPDYVPTNEYLRIEAKANLNLGDTTAKFIKSKVLERKNYYGSIKFN